MSEDMEMGAPPPEESGNRMFLIGAIILGGVFILALIGIIVLFLLTRSGQPAAPQPQNLTGTAAALQGATQTLNAQGTQTRVAIAIQTAVITYTPTLSQTKALTSTFTTTPVVFATLSLASETPTNTETPVGAAAATRTRTQIGATAVRTAAATALPTTGFGDSAGLPALILLGAGSLFVIILARQLRLSRVRR